MEVRRLNRLSRQLREIALRASQNNEEVPLSAGELVIVEYVARHPASTITDIARETGLAQSRVSTVVRHLSDERVFVCSKDAKDRRQTLVALSPEVAAQAFEEFGSRPINGALVTVIPHLSDDQAVRVTSLLDELATLMEPPERRASSS